MYDTVEILRQSTLKYVQFSPTTIPSTYPEGGMLLPWDGRCHVTVQYVCIVNVLPPTTNT